MADNLDIDYGSSNQKELDKLVRKFYRNIVNGVEEMIAQDIIFSTSTVADLLTIAKKEGKIENKSADLLKEIPFPQCADKCKAIKLLGASECDSVCSFKFEKRKIDAEKCDNVVETDA